MSVSAYLELKVVHSQGCEMNPVALVEQLMDYGWEPSINYEMSYLPLGDDGDFDWETEKFNLESLMATLREKELQGELIGVVLTWKDSGIGGQFLVYEDGTLSISMSINRKFIDEVEEKITDLNWYLVRILPAFNREGQQVISFKYEECS